eukprot:1554320-Rhodomonas_salina.3
MPSQYRACLSVAKSALGMPWQGRRSTGQVIAGAYSLRRVSTRQYAESVQYRAHGCRPGPAARAAAMPCRALSIFGASLVAAYPDFSTGEGVASYAALVTENALGAYATSVLEKDGFQDTRGQD